MKCPKCGIEQPEGRPECQGCGVIFAKVRAGRPIRPEAGIQDRPAPPQPRIKMRDLFLLPAEEVNPLLLAARALLWVGLGIWGLRFIFASIASNYAGSSFMHLVNLPFHEAGHIVFSPFGQLIQALGGTLGQLIMPAVCAAVLLLRTRDGFGAAVALWWLAESFMDIAPYVNDARALDLVLLGGVTGKEVEDFHDWELILRKLGLLRMDHLLAWTAQLTGIVLMLAALVWALLNLNTQYRAYRRSGA